MAPTYSHSFSATIVDGRTIHGELDEEVGLALSRDVLPGGGVPGDHRTVHVVRLPQVRGSRVTFDLPAGLEHQDGSDLTFLLGLD